jgi:CRP/FNR family cyclic AMP-dependent transcriptional regulator
MNQNRRSSMNTKVQISEGALRSAAGEGGPDTETKRNVEPVESLIRKHPFLKDLSPHQYRLLADSAMRTQFRAGDVIFQQGDPANRFYLIQHGKVAVEAWLKDRGTITIETLVGGDVLGWSWLFPPYYWQFGACALEDTDAVFIYGTPLREECESDHELGYELIKRASAVMLERLQATRRRLAGFPEDWLENFRKKV